MRGALPIRTHVVLNQRNWRRGCGNIEGCVVCVERILAPPRLQVKVGWVDETIKLVVEPEGKDRALFVAKAVYVFSPILVGQIASREVVG
jgi:hypothetical protein